jgi:hypothetical protein
MATSLRMLLSLTVALCIGNAMGQSIDDLLNQGDSGISLSARLQRTMASTPAAARDVKPTKAKGKDAVDELALHVIKDIQPPAKAKDDNKVRLDQVDIVARKIIRDIQPDTPKTAKKEKPKPKLDAVDELAVHVIKDIQPPAPKADNNKVRLDVVDLIARKVIRDIKPDQAKKKETKKPAPKQDAVDELAKHVIKDIRPPAPKADHNKVRLDQVDILARKVIRGDQLNAGDVPGEENEMASDISTKIQKLTGSEPSSARSS